MKQSGFTIVELIFVIIIIGILSSVALSKYNTVKSRARINSEIATMSSFDGAITAAIEFQLDDFGNGEVNWYNLDGGGQINYINKIKAALIKANNSKTVLGGIGKSVEKIKAIGFVPKDKNGSKGAYSRAWLCYSPVILTSTASDSSSGVEPSSDTLGDDVPRKPDKNDFWVFNPSSIDINITGGASSSDLINPRVIESGTVGLVDVNGTDSIKTNTIMCATVLDPTPEKFRKLE